MNERMNERTHERTYKRTNERTHARTRTHARANERKNERASASPLVHRATCPPSILPGFSIGPPPEPAPPSSEPGLLRRAAELLRDNSFRGRQESSSSVVQVRDDVASDTRCISARVASASADDDRAPTCVVWASTAADDGRGGACAEQLRRAADGCQAWQVTDTMGCCSRSDNRVLLIGVWRVGGKEQGGDKTDGESG